MIAPPAGAIHAEIARFLRYRARKDDVSLAAIKNNLMPAIRRFHRAGSALGNNILEELRQGRVVIVDVSFLTGKILGFIRAVPIAGNCYFKSAPTQPFDLSARASDFESFYLSTAPAAPEQEPEPART